MKLLTAGEMIQLRRRRLGWSQEKLSEKADCSEKSIIRLETGEAVLATGQEILTSQKPLRTRVALILGLPPLMLSSGGWARPSSSEITQEQRWMIAGLQLEAIDGGLDLHTVPGFMPDGELSIGSGCAGEGLCDVCGEIDEEAVQEAWVDSCVYEIEKLIKDRGVDLKIVRA